MRRNIAVFLSLAVCFSKVHAQDKSPQKVPLDGIVERHLVEQRTPLAYPNVQEGDLLWEKRIWQVVDTREKMNQPFCYPLQPFFEILVKAIREGEIVAYSSENDQLILLWIKSN
ncbi:MAG: hypothetical protein HC892_04120 [Saprospiraceae bacterium]|nr:hypothetical protein [Saprospiraceae bacterium]